MECSISYKWVCVRGDGSYLKQYWRNRTERPTLVHCKTSSKTRWKGKVFECLGCGSLLSQYSTIFEERLAVKGSAEGGSRERLLEMNGQDVALRFSWWKEFKDLSLISYCQPVQKTGQRLFSNKCCAQRQWHVGQKWMERRWKKGASTLVRKQLSCQYLQYLSWQ